MRFLILTFFGGVLFAGPLSAAEPELDGLQPQWQLGDQWTVETVSRPLHVRSDTAKAAVAATLRWQFRVVGIDKELSRPCYRVEVTCVLSGGRPPEGDSPIFPAEKSGQSLDNSQETPKTVLWLDRDSGALRRITTHVPVPGGFEEMAMNFDSVSGQPAPILGPLSALPIDTPVLYSGTKGMQTFSYTSHCGPAESKELGDVGFAHQIEQQIAELPREDVRGLFGDKFAKSLTGDAFSKSLTTRPVTEVRLKSQGREVRQLWQPERPWPIYSDNGYTVARLVSVERSTTDEEDRP